MAQANVQVVIDAVDNASPNIARVNTSLGSLAETSKRSDLNFRTLGRSIGLATSLMTSLGAATGTMNTGMLRAAGAASSLISAFAIGGPIVGGLTAGVIGLSFALGKVGDQAKRVKDALADAMRVWESEKILKDLFKQPEPAFDFKELQRTAQWEAVFASLGKEQTDWKVWERASLHAQDLNNQAVRRNLAESDAADAKKKADDADATTAARELFESDRILRNELIQLQLRQAAIARDKALIEVEILNTYQRQTEQLRRQQEINRAQRNAVPFSERLDEDFVVNVVLDKLGLTGARLSTAQINSILSTSGIPFHTPADVTALANENLLAQAAQMSISAAHGFHGMITQPTMFLAGEAGAERVDVSPAGKGSPSQRTEVSVFLDGRQVGAAIGASATRQEQVRSS